MVKQSESAFMSSLILLGLSGFFFFLCAYLLPSIWLGWVYPVPDSVFALRYWIQDSLQASETFAAWCFWDSLFALALLFAGLSYYFSHMATAGLAHLHSLASDDKALAGTLHEKRQQHESLRLGVRLVLILVCVFGVAQGLQWGMGWSH